MANLLRPVVFRMKTGITVREERGLKLLEKEVVGDRGKLGPHGPSEEFLNFNLSTNVGS
jgi:hypothetical protein